jgi:enoyl-CoA hydratase
MGEVGILSLHELVDRMASAYAAEGFSSLTGSGVLVVDMPAEDARVADRLVALGGQLDTLACPTIALCGRERGRATDRLLQHFDLVVEDGARGLEPLLGAIRANPQASLALVQLLRQNEKQDVHSGLVAESLVYSVLQSGPEFAAWRAADRPRTRCRSEAVAVLVEREGDVLSLTFNRPERHNAFSVALRDGLVEGLLLAHSDARIDEIVLRGLGPSFCSGGDLAEFGTFPDPATAHVIRSTRNPARLLAGVAERVRAEVHGACIGAGTELPAFARTVVAHEDAFFQLPECRIGLVPGAGGTVSVLRRIGRHRTAWLAITGERIDAPTALAWGLVDRIVPGD